MKAWKETLLKDVCHLITDGKHGDCKDENNSGYYFISAKDIRNWKIVYNNSRQITKADFEETHRRTNLEPLDILVVSTGANIGDIAIANNDSRTYKTTFQKSVAIIKPNKKLINPHFLMYFLFNSRELLHNISSGSAQKNLLLKDIRTISVPLPELSLQSKISSILASLNEKIFLLEELNEKYSSLANLIFSSFFLQNNLKFSDGCFGDIIYETSKKISSNAQGDYKVLSAVNTGNLIPSEDYFSKQVFSKDLSNYKVLERFDFAYNPARVNIGSIGMLDKPIKGCVSPVYCVFKAKPHWHYFVDLMIKQQNIRKTIEVYCSGSVRQVLRFSDFSRIEIKLPPEKKVIEFNDIYISFLNKINLNKQQIQKFIVLRDSILPKIITGKIEIKN